jgi:hypothetical protein
VTTQQKGLAVLAIQVVLVLSIGVKYEWERHHCPMVWARANQWDPSQPLRGRYLALTLHASACGLPGGARSYDFRHPGRSPQQVEMKMWRVVPAVTNGALTARGVDETLPGPTETLILDQDLPCEYARFGETSDFFIPEHARSPFPLQKGQELWALVTVPPSGPVRPVKLAISDATGFHVLDLD